MSSVTAVASVASKRQDARILSSGPRDPLIKANLVQTPRWNADQQQYQVNIAEVDLKPGQDEVSWLVAGRAGFALPDLAEMIIRSDQIVLIVIVTEIIIRSDQWISYCADHQISDLQIVLIVSINYLVCFQEP